MARKRKRKLRKANAKAKEGHAQKWITEFDQTSNDIPPSSRTH
jgi:hypothetical protein